MMDSQEARISISQTLMSATAGLLPVLAALVTFVYESRDAGGVFWLLVALAAVAYAGSIMLGGWGIEETAAGKPHRHFNNQAVALLVGTACLVGAFVSTHRREPGPDPLVQKLQSDVMDTRERLARVEERLALVVESHKREDRRCREDLSK